MKKFVVGIITILMLVGAYSEPARAVTTPNVLLNLCDINKPADDNANIYCALFILGTVETSEFFFLDGDDLGGYKFCRPDNTLNSQVNNIVWRYIREHPEQWHFAMITVTMLALREAFPCE